MLLDHSPYHEERAGGVPGPSSFSFFMDLTIQTPALPLLTIIRYQGNSYIAWRHQKYTEYILRLLKYNFDLDKIFYEE